MRRCAIYTRKSSEEGLEQDFNSLQAQREACEAYVLSQVGEGWRATPQLYDDGGFSGGSMERPALRRLLEEIERGQIDVVVVYKVDRLTPSLSDFARIVEAFDRRGASFVSVTQAFNTTTSMGRLTLNVLLSFAQFEREVTGERIRDKIAASKKKGMWMGGHPPLGYDPDGRTLKVNAIEAETVGHIFRRYLELGSVHRLRDELASNQVLSKRWETAQGRVRGGVPLGRGALFHLLRNRIYLGEIRHKDIWHPSQHASILDPELFDAVQAKLSQPAATTRASGSPAGDHRLKGKLVDERGRPMTPTFAYGKRRRSYRYYVVPELVRGEAGPDDGAIRRVPADAIEALIGERLARVLGGSLPRPWLELSAHLVQAAILPDAVHLLIRPDPAVLGGHDRESWVRRAGQRLTPSNRLQPEPETPDLIRLITPVRMQVHGGRTWITNPEGGRVTAAPKPDPALVKALRRAHKILAHGGASIAGSSDQPSEVRSARDSFERKIARLAFLVPDIQHAILNGCQPPGMTLSRLSAMRIPPAWADQRKALGFHKSTVDQLVG